MPFLSAILRLPFDPISPFFSFISFLVLLSSNNNNGYNFMEICDFFFPLPLCAYFKMKTARHCLFDFPLEKKEGKRVLWREKKVVVRVRFSADFYEYLYFVLPFYGIFFFSFVDMWWQARGLLACDTVLFRPHNETLFTFFNSCAYDSRAPFTHIVLTTVLQVRPCLCVFSPPFCNLSHVV